MVLARWMEINYFEMCLKRVFSRRKSYSPGANTLPKPYSILGEELLPSSSSLSLSCLTFKKWKKKKKKRNKSKKHLWSYQSGALVLKKLKFNQKSIKFFPLTNSLSSHQQGSRKITSGRDVRLRLYFRRNF